MKLRWALAGLLAAAASATCAQDYGAEDLPKAGTDAGVDVRDPAKDPVTLETDAAPPSESDASTDASLDAADAADVYDPCDKDKDGYRALSCPSGNDCDDDDPRAHPGQGFVTETPTATTNGNWDCTGGVEKNQLTNSPCNSRDSVTCQSFNGRFANDPACGANGILEICTYSGGVCMIATTINSAKMGCK